MPRPAAVLSLSAERPLRLAGARDLRVLAVSGTVWITACGVAEDIFLEAGDAYRIPTRGLVLVEAIGDDARVRLERPARPGVARWFGRLILAGAPMLPRAGPRP